MSTMDNWKRQKKNDLSMKTMVVTVKIHRIRRSCFRVGIKLLVIQKLCSKFEIV